MHVNPNEVSLWEDGWKHRKRPSLSKMLSTMNKEADIKQAQEICSTFNHLVHGDPIGASYNLVQLSSGDFVYSASKALSEPDLCDFICYQSYCYLIVIMGRMAACFPITKNNDEQL